MANVEINDLAAKATPVSTDEIEVQATAGGTSNKATLLNAEKGMIESGAGAPSSTPNHVGQRYVDTTNDNVYVATDTVSSADWEQVSLGGGTITQATEDTVPTSRFVPLDNDKKYDLGNAATEVIAVAASDETTALTTGTGKVSFRMPYAFELTGIKATVVTAPTGAALVADVNKAGTSIMTTNKLTIDVSEFSTSTAATAPTLTTTTFAEDDLVTVDIDTVGSTIAGAGLKVYLTGYVL